jgi:hypothetical protein
MHMIFIYKNVYCIQTPEPSIGSYSPSSASKEAVDVNVSSRLFFAGDVSCMYIHVYIPYICVCACMCVCVYIYIQSSTFPCVYSMCACMCIYKVQVSPFT